MPVVVMITRFVIRRREPFANGHEFPVTGAYEKLVGKIYGEVDPRNRLNKSSSTWIRHRETGVAESSTGATSAS